jgi:2-dehydro-3-deoxyphosphogluconate aldolase/(4S)-4-hydroxy-2-oxoglutarate aldolase
MPATQSRAEVLSDVLNGVRVIPVVVIKAVSAAVPLGQALIEGGLPIAEVTFRTAAARDSIREMAQLDGLVVGAGTVLSPDQVETAAEAGARFIVSPGFSSEVVRAARACGIPVVTGAATATEIQMALESGQDVVKLFPAEAVGGLATVKALSAPFPDVRFIPTGGITEASAPSYLAYSAVLAVGGSWMVAGDLLAAGDFAEVTRRSAVAASLASNAPAKAG